MPQTQTTGPIDLTHLLLEHEGKWIVLSKDNDRVLASGNSVEEIEPMAERGIVMKVPDLGGPFLPHSIL